MFVWRLTWPERWVPEPPTRGIRATARPVPQDSAEVWWPAFSLTAYACLLFFARLSSSEERGFANVHKMKRTLQILTVDLLHDIKTDGSGEDRGEGERGRSLCMLMSVTPRLVGSERTSGGGANVDGGAGGHS